MSTPPPRLPLWSDHTRFVRRHRLSIGLSLMVGLLAGFAWSLMQPSTFAATASVTLVPVPVYVMPTLDELSPPEVSIDTDAQLLRSAPVLAAVGDVLGTDAESTAQHISVSASPNTHVLHVTVTAAAPHTAFAATEAATTALVDVRGEMLGSLQDSQVRKLRLMTLERERQLAREQESRVVVPGRDDLFDQVVELRTRLAELEEARRRPAEVTRPARTPSGPQYANAEVPVASGAMAGLMAGCLLGAARDRRSRRPRPAHSHAIAQHVETKDHDHVSC